MARPRVGLLSTTRTVGRADFAAASQRMASSSMATARDLTAAAFGRRARSPRWTGEVPLVYRLQGVDDEVTFRVFRWICIPRAGPGMSGRGPLDWGRINHPFFTNSKVMSW